MAEGIKKGDKVEWNTPQGKTEGTVVERATDEKRVGNQGQKGTKVKGSKGDRASSWRARSPASRPPTSPTR